MSTLRFVLAVVSIFPSLLSGGLFAEGSSSGLSIGEVAQHSIDAGYKIAPSRLRGVSGEDLTVISEALEDLQGYSSCRQGDQWNFEGDCAVAKEAIKAIEDRLRLAAVGNAGGSNAGMEGNSPDEDGASAPVIEGDSGRHGTANPEAATKKFDRSRGSSGANLRPAVYVPEGGSDLATSQMTGSALPRVSGGRTRSLYRSGGVASLGGDMHLGTSPGGMGTRSGLSGDYTVRTAQKKTPEGGKLNSDELPIAESDIANVQSPVKAGIYDESSKGDSELFSKIGLRVGFLLMGTTGDHALAAAIFAQEKKAHWVGILPLNDEFNYKLIKFNGSFTASDEKKKQFETTVLTDRLDEKNREVVVEIVNRAIDASDAAIEVLKINFAGATNRDQLMGMIGQAVKNTADYFELTKMPNLKELAAKANVALKDLQEKAQNKEKKDIAEIKRMGEYAKAVEAMNVLDAAIQAHYGNSDVALAVENMKMEFRFKVADVWAKIRESFDDNDVYVIGGKEYWLQDMPVFRGDMTVKKLLAASVPHDQKLRGVEPIALKGTPFINSSDSRQLRVLAFFEKPANVADFPKVVAMLPMSSNTGDIVGAQADGTVSVKLGKDPKAPEITIKKSDLGPGSNYRWEIQDKSSGGGSGGGGPTGAPPTGSSSSAEKPKVGSFKIEPEVAKRGDKAKLSWSVEGADSVKINNETKASSGSQDFTVPSKSATEFTWKLVATNVNGTTEQTIKMTIDSGSSSSGTKPTISSFKADKSSIKTGESVTFSWSVSGASEVKFDGSVVSASGNKTVSPSATKTYTLSAKSADGGSNSKSVKITVGAATPAPGEGASPDAGGSSGGLDPATLFAREKSSLKHYDEGDGETCKGTWKYAVSPSDSHKASTHKHIYCVNGSGGFTGAFKVQ